MEDWLKTYAQRYDWYDKAVEVEEPGKATPNPLKTVYSLVCFEFGASSCRNTKGSFTRSMRDWKGESLGTWGIENWAFKEKEFGVFPAASWGEGPVPLQKRQHAMERLSLDFLDYTVVCWCASVCVLRKSFFLSSSLSNPNISLRRRI